ncbi:MAG: phosphate signaling complex protein PhoU [Lysinibacillus sp.]
MAPRENFEKNLSELQGKLVEMVDLTTDIIELAFTALKTQDVELALKVIENDNEIDDLENEINQMAIWLMAKEQPVARDLRRIVSIIKISAGIERIADFAVNIAKSTIMIGKQPSLLDLSQLEQMKITGVMMLKKAIESFSNEDINLAKEVGDLDDKVDDMNKETYETLTQYLKTHADDTEQLVQMLFVNRYLERIADHVTNIAESTAYLIKGQIYDFNH